MKELRVKIDGYWTKDGCDRISDSVTLSLDWDDGPDMPAHPEKTMAAMQWGNFPFISADGWEFWPAASVKH